MKKMVVAGVIVTSWILACLLAIAAELPAIRLIPKKFNNIQIVKPDPSVPKEVADFSGEWEGAMEVCGANAMGFFWTRNAPGKTYSL